MTKGTPSIKHGSATNGAEQTSKNSHQEVLVYRKNENSPSWSTATALAAVSLRELLQH